MTRTCEHCGTEGSIRQTPPWQDDLCKECGESVSSPEVEQ